MGIPDKLPGLKTAILLFGILALVWISLEGDPRWSSLMAVWLLLIGIGFIVQRYFGGRTLRVRGWIGLMALCGLVIGLLFLPTALVFMALKTGLHGHGPEFAEVEMRWLLDRFIIWAAAGLSAGLGFGLLALGLSRSAE